MKALKEVNIVIYLKVCFVPQNMVEFLRKIFFGFAFLCLVNCNDVVHIPSNEPVYETRK